MTALPGKHSSGYHTATEEETSKKYLKKMWWGYKYSWNVYCVDQFYDFYFFSKWKSANATQNRLKLLENRTITAAMHKRVESALLWFRNVPLQGLSQIRTPSTKNRKISRLANTTSPCWHDVNWGSMRWLKDTQEQWELPITNKKSSCPYFYFFTTLLLLSPHLSRP